MSDNSEDIIDQAVTRAYRRFKDWSKRGFGPDEVTWCEVRADLVEISTNLAKEEIERQAAEIERLRRALDLLTAAADLNGAVAAIAEIADAEGLPPSDVIPVWPNRTKQDREAFYGSGSDYPQVEIGHVKALQAALHSAREALKGGEVE